jgi:hypothetical protein
MNRTFTLTLLIWFSLAVTARSHPGPGIVVDHLGQVYFVHGIKSRIMKVDAAGKLSIFVQGVEGGKLSVPHHLWMDTNENIYSVGDRDSVVWRIAPDGKTTEVYPAPNFKGNIGSIGSGGDPFTLDSLGNIYFVQSNYGEFTQISKLRSDGRITVLAGGAYGSADGRGEDARFGNLHVGSFAWCPDGWLAISDSMTSIRKMAPAGRVFTLTDEKGKKLQFKGARGLASDREGNLFAADGMARQIYKITSAGHRTTVAGTGEPGDQDGPAGKATFLDPAGVFVDSKGTIYVLDYLGDDPRVRKISAEGIVTTIAKTENSR